MANRRHEIWNILIVLSAAVATAVIVAAFFVVNYGPSGRYALESALIAPSTLKGLDFNDNNPRISTTDRYVFDKIVFMGNQISLKEYQKLYDILKNDISVKDAEGFSWGNPKLVIYVKTESPSSWQNDAKVFQEIEFQKDYYRVSLHESASEIAFAYFSHPGILDSVQKLLNE